MESPSSGPQLTVGSHRAYILNVANIVVQVDLCIYTMGYVEYTADFLTGAAFGAALRASGVYSPAVIISQLNSTNWHMVEMFLTASGTSTYVAPAFPSQ